MWIIAAWIYPKDGTPADGNECVSRVVAGSEHEAKRKLLTVMHANGVFAQFKDCRPMPVPC